MKSRLDQMLAQKGLVVSRSQAESQIKLGQVTVNGKVITKPGALVREDDIIKLTATEQYVSRAALKLASVAEIFGIDFRGKVVLDVGSSTGGFTQYAIKRGATKVIAVEVGTDQLHPSLHGHPQIELHEKTDIRDVRSRHPELVSGPRIQKHEIPNQVRHDGDVEIDIPDIVVADVSFISLREILPSVAKLTTINSQIVVMVKPQFEAGASNLKHKGVIKNDAMRRDILRDFETWASAKFRVVAKADSAVSGAKGNKERFYVLKKLG